MFGPFLPLIYNQSGHHFFISLPYLVFHYDSFTYFSAYIDSQDLKSPLATFSCQSLLTSKNIHNLALSLKCYLKAYLFLGRVITYNT